jgi:translin
VSANNLTAIVDDIRQEMTAINDLRDDTLKRSRMLIRSCAQSIRAVHRHDWDEAETLLAQAREEARAMVEPLADYPMLYHTGYTQDALKELVEAHLVYGVVRNQEPPTPEELMVTGATYLNGMSEAATEMRRFVLDLMRRDEVEAAEPYLDFMDDVYSLLITVDFPDAITYGLRRQTDILRNVLERTRGDLTMGLRQDRMRDILRQVEARIDEAQGE